MEVLEPVYLDILIPDYVIEEDSSNYPIKAEKYEGVSYVRTTINIKTAKVMNWKPEYGHQVLWCKVVDEGIYILRDADGNELDRIEGYVPNKLIPEHDGYGDYIDMTISSTGYVTNWYKQPKLDEFNVDFDEIKRVFTEDVELNVEETL